MTPSSAARLAEWLARLETRQDGPGIRLGLERVREVWAAMRLDPAFVILTVGGTNGKGSTCALLDAMLRAAGYRVGLYTSPHLLRYSERVRIDAEEAPAADLVDGFDAVEAARGAVALTYFEHATLAALWLFCRRGVDVAVLEVGLGGRLDAVNVLDADCAVVCSVDLDHQEYLGPDRESIGFEKAGIYRPGRPAICADPDPPARLIAHAGAIGARLSCLGREFDLEIGAAGWNWRMGEARLDDLPPPALAGGAHQYRNAAAAVAALHSLRDRLTLPRRAIEQGLRSARPRGRFECIGDSPRRIVDVAHNPHAARALADSLARSPAPGRLIAVLAMLADKDIDGVVAALAGQVSVWHAASLPGPRGAPADRIAAAIATAGGRCMTHADVASAWRAANQEAGGADTILAFGSFYTVADVMALRAVDSDG